MNNTLPVISDILVIFFDLLIFTKMFSLRREDRAHIVVMYVGCALILTAYFAAAYVYEVPASVASFGFMTIPSFCLFYILSKHRDSRFLLTFCFVDTISLIIAFIGRYIGIMLPGGEIFSIVFILVLYLVLLALGNRHFKSYHKLLDEVKKGWGVMAAATVLIYFALVFFAAYPKPMIRRIEYAPTWLVFGAIVILCYVVFIQSIVKTKLIAEKNKKLEREKEVYQMAYTDALTGLFNRASYIEKVNQLEADRSNLENICCIVMDINNFKEINDTMGHYIGDKTLVGISQVIRDIFQDNPEYLFRMGGDEFFIIMKNVSVELVKDKIRKLRYRLLDFGKKEGLSLTASVGCAWIGGEEEGSIEETFVEADKKMYQNKKNLKLKSADL